MNDKETQLLHAAMNGRTDDVRALLRDGANIEAKDDDGWTALHHVAWNGRAEAVRMLLDAGANIEVKDSDGWTALHYAAWDGHVEVMRVLLEAGADPEAKTCLGKTVHDLAVKNNKPDVAGLLDAWAAQNSLLGAVKSDADAGDQEPPMAL